MWFIFNNFIFNATSTDFEFYWNDIEFTVVLICTMVINMQHPVFSCSYAPFTLPRRYWSLLNVLFWVSFVVYWAVRLLTNASLLLQCTAAFVLLLGGPPVLCLAAAWPMRKCLGKHSCMGSTFAIAILNDTCCFLKSKLSVFMSVILTMIITIIIMDCLPFWSTVLWCCRYTPWTTGPRSQWCQFFNWGCA